MPALPPLPPRVRALARRFLGDLPVEVAVLAAVAFSVAVGFGIVAPAIPVFAREFGVTRTAASAVVSAFAFMRLVSALGGGRLVDRLGERVVLATGIGIVAVSSALAGLAQNYAQLLVLRGVGGIGSAMFTVSAISLVLRVAAPELRGRATGLFQAGFLVGGVTGPAFGGFLAEVSLRLPFFVYAATLAVAGSIAMLFLTRAELAEKEADGTAPQRTSLGEALRHRAYRAALVGNLGVGWALFGVRMAVIPLFVVEGLDLGAKWVGIGFVVSSAAQGLLLLPAGRVADTVGRRPAMILGGTVSSVAMVLLALSTSAPLYVVAMVLFGSGSAFLGVAPGAVVGDVVSGRGGTTVAFYQMAADFGAVVGPLLAGLLADEVSYGAAFASTAVVLAAGALMGVRMPETRGRSRGTPAT
ncbi:MAG: MFS transporter [Actinomycetes bacterium]